MLTRNIPEKVKLVSLV